MFSFPIVIALQTSLCSVLLHSYHLWEFFMVASPSSSFVQPSASMPSVAMGTTPQAGSPIVPAASMMAQPNPSAMTTPASSLTLVPPSAPIQGLAPQQQGIAPSAQAPSQGSPADSFTSPTAPNAGSPAKVTFAPPQKSVVQKILAQPASAAAVMGAGAAIAGAALATGLHAVKANTLATGAILYALIGIPVGYMVGKINQSNSRFEL
jgi:hypothetical protein